MAVGAWWWPGGQANAYTTMDPVSNGGGAGECAGRQAGRSGVRLEFWRHLVGWKGMGWGNGLRLTSDTVRKTGLSISSLAVWTKLACTPPLSLALNRAPVTVSCCWAHFLEALLAAASSVAAQQVVTGGHRNVGQRDDESHSGELHAADVQ